MNAIAGRSVADATIPASLTAPSMVMGSKFIRIDHFL
jgi:hypothetical protein